MFWQKRLREFIARMRHHELPIHLRLWNGEIIDLGGPPRVTLGLNSVAALRHLFRPSMASLGQAYVEGEIEVNGKIDDVIDAVVRLATHNGPPVRRGPRLARHTRQTDAAAIAYHYDVSNDFYKLWLDRQMVYSCAYFRDEGRSLEGAQEDKLDHILTKIMLRPGHRLLDIGCGWGALAIRAAQNYGAQVVGITLSRHQYDLARERIAAAGLERQVDIRLQNYRDVSGTFDRVTSVGMFEHVGLRNLRGYFTKIRQLLADDGICMNHGITSTDPESAESPLGGGDFIDRYVFPHGELPHLSLVLKEMAAAGLEALDVENLRRHYALTTQHWSRRFEQHAEQIRSLAGERRYRIWRAYLAGCCYGFQHHWISLHQVLAAKSGHNVTPMTRDYMYPG